MLDRWRARIGWITPRVNSDTELYDFYQIAPKDVVVVVNSLAVVNSARKEEIEASIGLIERSVEHLNLSGVDHVMKKGAPIHLHFGNEGHNKIIERMRAVSKAPVSTSSQALADGFNHLGVKRLLVISSWRKNPRTSKPISATISRRKGSRLRRSKASGESCSLTKRA